MTIAKLLSNKRFNQFCFFEYGIESSELLDTSCAELYKLMQKWYECPEMLYGPRGAIREEVKRAIADGKLKQGRKNTCS